MTRKRFINTDRFVAALHAHRVAGDGFAPDYFPCAEFRLASPNFLFGASNSAVCKVGGSPRLVGNSTASPHCGVILSTQ